MNQAIEYLMDALALANNSHSERDSEENSPSINVLGAVQSQDSANSTNQTDGSSGSGVKGTGEAAQTRQRRESRTLDQYFYSSLPDTVRRDADQVIVRYQAKKRYSHKEDYGNSSSMGENAASPPPNKNNKTTNNKAQSSDRQTNEPPKYPLNENYMRYQEKFKLCMLDQLWLWVLDNSEKLYREVGKILYEADIVP
ncbi:uncharacterized protein N7483_000407 [Penicillium malachiteum]|uniref:uncharacterized protein n=1 Tax=Penicillium malachiteum TaxID=1324776 RepID=UPI002549AABD|nr:uncharacterized protein N7483_000407 [Penicillium malachiteum]KAJ5735282.1 hypothetical protein N7483_000407 [Penicillium malachiteum]